MRLRARYAGLGFWAVYVSVSMSAQLSTGNAQGDYSNGWVEKTLTPDTAEAFLQATLHGNKHVTIRGVIAETKYKDVNLGTSCRSRSTGKIEGEVNDNGDVTGTVNTSGTTNCSENHNYFYWMDVAYADGGDSGYIVTARCDVRWIWNHCALPVEGMTDGMVLEREKKGKYALYIYLRKGALDRKGTVSKYEIVDLKHFERATDNKVSERNKTTGAEIPGGQTSGVAKGQQ